MDIPGLSMALANVSLQNDVSVAVLGKAMDLGQEMGDGIVDMIDSSAMERSVTPYLGGNIDLRV